MIKEVEVGKKQGQHKLILQRNPYSYIVGHPNGSEVCVDGHLSVSELREIADYFEKLWKTKQEKP